MADPYGHNPYAPPPAPSYTGQAQSPLPLPPPPPSSSQQSTVPYGGAYGPPYQGGFQHGQQYSYGATAAYAGAPAGPYDPSQQQHGLPGYGAAGGYYPAAGHAVTEHAGQRADGYYQQPPLPPPPPTDHGVILPPVSDYTNQSMSSPSSPSSQFPQQGAYNQAPYPADPNMPGPGPDGDRGLGGAIMGGLAGHYAGKKKNHGLLGTIGGALIGSYAQDHLKTGGGQQNHRHANRPGHGHGLGGFGGFGFGGGKH